MTPEFIAIRAFAKAVLDWPLEHRWTIQGFGMLRTYIPGPAGPKQFRLNLWNSTFAVPNVSVIHDHPWSFDSWIISGAFRNVRFVDDHFNGDSYHWATIKCGEEGDNSTRDKHTMNLRALPVEHYVTGQTYHQEADEIHLSDYVDGTVTLNSRVGDTEHARVFWPAGTEWVDAKPREADAFEIERATKAARDIWSW